MMHKYFRIIFSNFYYSTVSFLFSITFEKTWNSARAIMVNPSPRVVDPLSQEVVEIIRARQLIYIGILPMDALELVWKVRNYSLAPGDRATSEVPLHPPPFGYNGCHDCWDSLNNIRRRRAWIPFWIATGQVTITEIGGGVGGEPAAGAAGKGP